MSLMWASLSKHFMEMEVSAMGRTSFRHVVDGCWSTGMKEVVLNHAGIVDLDSERFSHFKSNQMYLCSPFYTQACHRGLHIRP